MKYQIVIIENPYEPKPKRTKLKTHIPIGDAGFWQRRTQQTSDDCQLGEVISVVVAKDE